jgi:hypothetical protein
MMYIKITKEVVTAAITTLLLLALAGLVGTTVAQTPGPEAGPQGAISIAAAVNNSINYQGILEENGVPVNDTRDMTFSFFTNDTCTDPAEYVSPVTPVSITDGFFDVDVDVPHDLFDGQGVWLEVEVDATPLGCEALLPTPYALSLRPGAIIADEKTGDTFGDGIVNVDNTAPAFLGSATGLFARSATGSAVRAESDSVGVSAESLWRPAVIAESASGTAATFQSGGGYGVRVNTDGDDHWDHAGYFTANWGYGLYVTSTHNMAVRGESGAIAGLTQPEGHVGVAGIGEAQGVYGSSTTDGYGVVGVQSGYSTEDQTGYFESGGLFGGTNGLIGLTRSNTGYGVIGWNQATVGSPTVGVYGRSDSPQGWGGYYFSAGRGVYASVPIGNVGLSSNGTKPAVVTTTTGARLLYAEESTEIWFSDYGFGTLVGGVITVTIDPTFAETVNLSEPYHVFVEPYGPASLYVTDRTPTSFVVRAQTGDPDVDFSYRLVAKRLGHEEQRLERAPWADDDPYLYPQRAGATQRAPDGGER